MTRKLYLAVSVILLASVWSCGGKKAEERKIEKAIEKQTGGKVKADISKGKVEIKTKEGQMTIAQEGGAQVPEGFPKDVLVYQGAAVIMSLKDQKTFSLTLQTKDDVKKVTDAYKDKMKSEGWEEKMTMSMPEGNMLQYKKGEQDVSISITKSDDKTMIQLVVEMGEK